MNGARCVLLCTCDRPEVAPPDRGDEALAEAVATSGQVVFTTDLCGAVARRDPWLSELARGGEALTVAACRPRAVRWLFAAAGEPLPAGARLVDLRAAEPAGALLGGPAAPPRGVARPAEVTVRGAVPGWEPWFPVIDRDRCTGCQQCASFCLFGVFSVTPGGAVEVSNPRGCKTNCPACARICPSAAIIFPKLGEAPLDGSEVTDEEQVAARARASVQQILGDDVVAGLAERRRRARQRLLRPGALEQALAERARHLPLAGGGGR